MQRLIRPLAAVLVLAILAGHPAAYAGAIASKTAANQTLGERATDVALAKQRFATDRIAGALVAEGLTPAQIETRLRALTTTDVLALGSNPQQIRTAGVTMTRKAWTITGIALGALAIGAFALENDDEEDSDESDDGED